MKYKNKRKILWYYFKLNIILFYDLENKETDKKEPEKVKPPTDEQEPDGDGTEVEPDDNANQQLNKQQQEADNEDFKAANGNEGKTGLFSKRFSFALLIHNVGDIEVTPDDDYPQGYGSDDENQSETIPDNNENAEEEQGSIKIKGVVLSCCI